LTLDPSPAQIELPSDSPAAETATPPAGQEGQKPPSFAITCVAWAPSLGRSYHLIATGGRDGRVRIWRVKPAVDDENDDMGDGEDFKWTATVVADFDHNK
jgi:nucleoporin SEH1